MSLRSPSFATAKECVWAIKAIPNNIAEIQHIWNYAKEKNYRFDAVDYTQLLKQCCTPHHKQLGQNIIQHLKHNLQPKQIDPILLTSMANMLIKCGDPKLAVNLWTDSVPADRVLYMTFLMACTDSNRIDIGTRVHKHIETHRYRLEPTVLSCLIKMYSKCNQPEQVKELWNAMIKNRIRPDTMLYTSVLTACADWAKKWNATEEDDLKNSPILDLGRKVHKHIVDHGIRLDGILCNSIMNMYVRCGEPQVAIHIWHQMLDLHIRLNQASYTIALLACAETTALQQGQHIHQMLVKNNVRLDNTVGTALVTLYAKCGDTKTAEQIFKSMQQSIDNIDVTAWNTIILAFSLQGDWEGSLALFNSMLEAAKSPDAITFTHLLNAASHAGQIEVALKIYDAMQTDYGVTPNLTHQTVIVDVLSRSGRLQDAVDFIHTNIPNPNIITWRTLLGGCRTHTNVEWAEYAANAALKINPKSASIYVMLGNIYAAAGRWDDRQRIRDEMDQQGIQKIPGQSQIEINGQIHTFIMRDDSHPELSVIHKKIKQMQHDLKKAGFKSDTSWVLKNINEEEKEDDLCYHSEKLAMAYGLLHTPPKSSLTITKNLRVCGNCHSSTKMFSKIYARDIIVRDASRFHHFHNGKCSCNDFW